MKTKVKVLAYFFRIRNASKEVLVFDHKNMLEAGTQIIGGTVDPGEDLVQALIREIYEESGITLEQSDIEFISQTVYQRTDLPEINHRHYFKINGSELPDEWEHLVRSDGEDNGLVFQFFWIPIAEAKLILTGNFAELIDRV